MRRPHALKLGLHLALIFALLFAQQAGFVHALSHFASGPVSTTASALQATASFAGTQPDSKIPENTRHAYQACAQCLVVSLADAAVSTHARIAPLASAAVLQAASVVVRVSRRASTAFLARGPPVTT